MTRVHRRAVRAMVERCTLAALLVCSAGCTRERDLPLPTPSRREALSPAFDAALAEAYASARGKQHVPVAVRRLARLYHANGFYREARACYSALAAIPAELTARDRYYLADIARQESDLAAAESALAHVLQLEPTYAPARLSLAEVLFKAGRTQEAEAHYAALVGQEPNHPQAALGLARIELQRGRQDAALARLEELVAAHPESTAAAGLLGQVLERVGDTDRAIALKQWSRQKPEPIPADPWMSEVWAELYDVQRLGLMFEDYFRTGQTEEAATFLRRLETLDPKNPLPHLLRGWSEAQRQQHGPAAEYYRRALAQGGDPEKIGPYLAQSLLALDQVNAAAAVMADIYAKMPESVPVLTAYSDVVLRQGNDELARTLLTKLLEKEPFLQAQNMSLARILWSAGERDAAVVCLQRVASVAPEDVPSRALLGEYFLDAADPVSALVPLAQALPHAPPNSPAQTRLAALLGTAYWRAGELAAEKNEFATAVKHAEKLIALFPNDVRGYGLKANGCVQLQQFSAAAEALAKMAALQPENPTIQLSLGDVLFQAGNAAQAQTHWQTARRLVRRDDTELAAALDDRLAGRVGPETFK